MPESSDLPHIHIKKVKKTIQTFQYNLCIFEKFRIHPLWPPPDSIRISGSGAIEFIFNYSLSVYD